MRIKRRR